MVSDTDNRIVQLAHDVTLMVQDEGSAVKAIQIIEGNEDTMLVKVNGLM